MIISLLLALLSVDKSFIKIGITRPELFSGKTYFTEIDRIVYLLDNDIVNFIHLRKPEASQSQLADILSDLPDRLYQRISLHDHFQLFNKFPIGGIHLNSRTTLDWYDRLFDKHSLNKSYNELRLSKSFHYVEELTSNRYQLDFATLSPIFNSFSKTGYNSAFDIDTLAHILSQINCNIIALGGVTPMHFDILKKVGFRGAAMLGYLFPKK